MRLVGILLFLCAVLHLFEWSSSALIAAGHNSTGEQEAYKSVAETPKSGHCPKRLTVIPSKRACSGDSDCPALDKCCTFSCGAVCVPAAFTKAGVCPRRKRGYGMCAEFCTDDSDCPRAEKCCFNGCGHECVTPYTVKPGRCTRPSGTPMCAEFCYHDGECPDEQKCCRTTCGHACSDPC